MGHVSLDDRAALADLVASYARAVDRRDHDAITELFAPGGRLVINRPDADPDVIERAAIASTIRDRQVGLLATSHFLGQQLVEVDGDVAETETYCVAQHISVVDGARWNRVMNIRYLDRCARAGDGWRFEQRTLMVDWVEHWAVGGPPVAATAP